MDPKAQLKQLKIIHMAVITGLVLFCLIIVYFNSNQMGVQFDNNSGLILLVVANILTFFSLIVGQIIYKRKITEITIANSNLSSKLEAYKPALIIRLATIEGPALFLVIIFFIMSSYLALAEAVALIIIMFFYAPTINRLRLLLNLNYSEEQQLLK